MTASGSRVRDAAKCRVTTMIEVRCGPRNLDARLMAGPFYLPRIDGLCADASRTAPLRRSRSPIAFTWWGAIERQLSGLGRPIRGHRANPGRLLGAHGSSPGRETVYRANQECLAKYRGVRSCWRRLQRFAPYMT